MDRGACDVSLCYVFLLLCFDDAYMSATTLKQLLAMSASSRLDSLDALLLSGFICMFVSVDLGCSLNPVGGVASAEGFGTCVQFLCRS